MFANDHVNKILSHKNEQWLRWASVAMALLSFALGFVVKDKDIVIICILIACFYQFTRMIFYVFGALLWKRQMAKETNPTELAAQPDRVSILIPCYNEKDVIENSLKNFESIDYKNIEVIVIDDGSSDETFDLAKQFSETSKIDIKVLRQKNMGKACALNLGIQQATGNYIFCADADSLIDSKALTYGLRAMKQNPSISAVAGSVRVLDPKNLIQSYQEIEYSLGDVQKSFLSHSGAVNIIPGPAGLFKKSALEQVGGYETEQKTFAEDTELTLRLLAANHKIIFEPRMFSWTQAPEDMQTLIRQRYRWNRGIYQALRKNIDLLITNNKIKFSWYLLFEKVWTPVVDFCLLIFLLGQFICSAKIDLFVSYNIFIFATEVVALGVTHFLSKRSRLDYILILFISRFTLSILITTWKFLCLQEEWSRKEMTWDKLDRQALRPLAGKI